MAPAIGIAVLLTTSTGDRPTKPDTTTITAVIGDTLREMLIASTGLIPKLEATGGASDANFYNRYGVPCTVLSVGMQKAHTTDEFIEEEDLYLTAEIILAIIKEAAQ
ncbi:hypothetical protein SDC9_169088 [bioreactor metagenome]|uniref:Uncharacterized protein n=1 Tax=bioreactor metagenome TaxID=1076179 RepID=A0A645G4C7_9ZZZZ